MSDSLQVRGLSAGYQGRPVLQGLTLAPIVAGQVTALIGPNAAGKTTLLRALAGLVRGTGVALLGDRDLLAMSVAERAKFVSYMPQALPERVSLTVIESVIAAARASDSVFDAGGKAMADRAVAVLDRLDITDIALAPLHELSGGQRQLAALAQTLVRDPAVVLLDEPTSALDLRHQVTVMGMARRLAADGKVVVCVLHDLTQAARWSDAMVVLSQGNLYRQGPPEEIVTPQMLSEVYGVVARVDRRLGFSQIVVDDVVVQSKP